MLIRIFDIFFSFLALVFLSPLLILIAFFLKITGEGEIFYFQKRVGLDEKEFNLIKFATMMKNSESLGSGTITIDNDFRILPFGKILRKTKINELPQILNVLKGDMSLIGPRPLVKSGYDSYPENLKYRLSKIKPGLSGISSIILRNEENILSKVNNPIEFHSTVLSSFKATLEVWYDERKSLLMYFCLIFITVWKIFFKGSKILFLIFKSLPKIPSDLEEYYE